MIWPLLALAMAIAPAGSPPEEVDRATRAYSQCLDRVMEAELKAKAGQAEFAVAADGACGAQADAMRRALVADAIPSGMPRAQAELDAATQVEHMTALFRTTYDLYRKYGPQLRPPS